MCPVCASLYLKKLLRERTNLAHANAWDGTRPNLVNTRILSRNMCEAWNEFSHILCDDQQLINDWYKNSTNTRRAVYIITNCLLANFKSTKFFLGMAAHYKQRVYQLDFIAAFLQADVVGRKFTTLPGEWKELFKAYPEIHEYLGRPLLNNNSNNLTVQRPALQQSDTR